MKYMTFNSSCSYAGLANMLSFYGIDTTDRQIALDMKLPYLFAYEDGQYLAGPSMQSARWFDLYLNPLGFALDERPIPGKEVSAYLRAQKCAMLGVFVENSGKHAVIYTGAEGSKLYFLNNKWEQDPAPETLLLTEAELLQRIDEPCIIATLRQISPSFAPIRERMEESIPVLHQYRQQLIEVCTAPVPTMQLRQLLNPLFRALLLDGITMLDLLGETALQDQLTVLQHAFLNALHSDAAELRLSDHLPVDQLSEIIDDYIRLIEAAME